MPAPRQVLLVAVPFALLVVVGLQPRQLPGQPPPGAPQPRTIVAYSLEKAISEEDTPSECVGSTRPAPGGAPPERRNAWRQLAGAEVYLLSAHRDHRLQPHKYARIIGMVQGSAIVGPTLYCSFVVNGTLLSAKANLQEIWLREWDAPDETTYSPVLVSCRLPKQSLKLTALSISTDPCDLSNVQLDLPQLPAEPSKAFVVCVKPLRFDNDITEDLVPWIELNRLLGADRFDIYVQSVPERVDRLLKGVYPKIFGNLVRTIDFSPAGKRPAQHEAMHRKSVWQRRRDEVVAYNDCLYRNLHQARFVVPIDIDEVIVPRGGGTWKRLLDRLLVSRPDLGLDYASLTVRNAYYLSSFTGADNGEPLAYFRHLVRSELSPDGESGKSFIITANALTVFNHYTLATLRPGTRRTYFLPRHLVQMNHYKKACSVDLLPECAKYTSSPKAYDPVVYKYKPRLMASVGRILNEINTTSD